MILKTLLLLILIPLVFFIVTLGFFILQIWKMKKEGKVQSISITVAPKDDGETANFRLVDRVRLEGEIFDQAYRDETTLTVKPRPFELNLLSPEACAYLGVALAEIDVKMCENTRVLKGTRSQRISRVTSTADTLIEGETYMIVQRLRRTTFYRSWHKCRRRECRRAPCQDVHGACRCPSERQSRSFQPPE